MTRPWRLGAPRTCSSAAALPRRGLPADCGFVAHRQRGMATSAGALVAVWRTASTVMLKRRTGRVQHRGAAEILLLRRRRAVERRAVERARALPAHDPLGDAGAGRRAHRLVRLHVGVSSVLIANLIRWTWWSRISGLYR